MIQRIQSVYFLTIAILSCITFFAPVANLYDPFNFLLYKFDYRGLMLTDSTELVVMNNSATWSLKIISAIIPLLAVAALLLFKKRMLQARLSFVNLLLMLGYYAILSICVIRGAHSLEAEWSLNLPAAFPLVCAVLDWLAIRAIGKDEALVRSLNRLR